MISVYTLLIYTIIFLNNENVFQCAAFFIYQEIKLSHK